MSPLDQFFKFAVGSFVRLAGASTFKGDGPRGWLRADKEQRMQIIERTLQECPGGMQRHYACRVFSAEGHVVDRIFSFNEIELVQSEAFPEVDLSSTGK